LLENLQYEREKTIHGHENDAFMIGSNEQEQACKLEIKTLLRL
jgi:hypothetical protein